MAGAVHRASWLPFVWQAQYTQLPEQAAARVAAAGPRLPFVSLITHHSPLHHFSHFTHQDPTHHYTSAHILTHDTTRVAGAVHRASWPAAAPLITTPLLTSHSSHHACGRCSTQSLLARGCLSCGRPSTQSFLAAFRVAGAIHRASWTSCGARGRRWPRLPVVSLITHHSSLHHALITSHSSHHSCGWRSTQSLLEELRRVAGAVRRALAAAGPRLPFMARGRRWPAAAFRVAGAVHTASWTSCGARGRRWPAAAFVSLITHHSPLHHFSHLTHQDPTHHYTSAHILTHDTTRVAGAV